jgi:LysM repeat protein
VAEAGPGAGDVSGDVYVVQSGDTLSKIARENGTSVEALKELNGLILTTIYPNQKLKLPPRNAP